HAGNGVRSRGERAARRLDDDVPARRAQGGDHTRADGAAESAVHVGDAGARRTSQTGRLPVVAQGFSPASGRPDGLRAMRGVRSCAMKKLAILFAVAAAAWPAAQTRNQATITIDPSLYQQVFYRPLSAAFSRGGRVTAVTGVASNTRLYYMGAAGG